MRMQTEKDMIQCNYSWGIISYGKRELYWGSYIMYVLFFLAWIIFNGNITLEIVVFGVVIAAVMIAFMCRFMDYSLKREMNVYKKSIKFDLLFLSHCLSLLKCYK